MIGAPSRRGRTLPGWAAGALALVCLVGGVLIGRHLVPATPDAGTGLSAAVSGRGPQAPGVLENEGATAPLASEAFLVAFYNFDDAGSEREARARASSLSKYLQEQGFEMARPYRYAATGRFAWCVMVYYDGASQRDATAEALRALPEDVPCEAFRAYKKNLGAGWPQSCPV